MNEQRRLEELLHRVTDQHAPAPDGFERIGARMRARRRRRVARRTGLGVLAVAAVAAVVVTVSSPGSGRQTVATSSGPSTSAPAATGNAGTSPATSAPPRHVAGPGVVATLHLSGRVVAAGGSLRATVVVDNRTGRAIHDTGCGQLFQVLLTNAAHPGNPAWTTCVTRFTVPPGRSTYRTSVLARLSRCGGQGAPACTPQGTPPLPPGEYEATAYEVGTAVPLPAPQPVRVRARS